MNKTLQIVAGFLMLSSQTLPMLRALRSTMRPILTTIKTHPKKAALTPMTLFAGLVAAESFNDNQREAEFKLLMQDIARDEKILHKPLSPQKQDYVEKKSHETDDFIFSEKEQKVFESMTYGQVTCKTKIKGHSCGAAYYTMGSTSNFDDQEKTDDKKSKSVTYISRIDTEKNYRRKGIATKMLQIIEESSAEHKDSALELLSVSSKEAQDCYKKFGFTSIRPHYGLTLMRKEGAASKD